MTLLVSNTQLASRFPCCVLQAVMGISATLNLTAQGITLSGDMATTAFIKEQNLPELLAELMNRPLNYK